MKRKLKNSRVPDVRDAIGAAQRMKKVMTGTDVTAQIDLMDQIQRDKQRLKQQLAATPRSEAE